jgi:hypothetical protein
MNPTPPHDAMQDIGKKLEAPRLYARVLERGVRLGLAVLAAAFGIYMTGLIPSQIPPQEIEHVWQLPLKEYLRATGLPTGWQWLKHLDRADFLPLLGIAGLTGATLASYMALAGFYWRRKERIFLTLCLLEILVLLFAASGFGPGGH